MMADRLSRYQSAGTRPAQWTGWRETCCTNGEGLGRMHAMDKQLMEALARRAGLDKALAQFPDDVAAAAKQAATVTAKIKPPSDPRAEPWPAMKPGDGL